MADRWAQEEALRERVRRLNLTELGVELTRFAVAVFDQQAWIDRGKDEPQRYLQSSEKAARDVRDCLDRWLATHFGRPDHG